MGKGEILKTLYSGECLLFAGVLWITVSISGVFYIHYRTTDERDSLWSGVVCGKIKDVELAYLDVVVSKSC